MVIIPYHIEASVKCNMIFKYFDNYVHEFIINC